MAGRKSFEQIMRACRDLEVGDVRYFNPDEDFHFGHMIVISRAAAGRQMGICVDVHEDRLRIRRTE